MSAQPRKTPFLHIFCLSCAILLVSCAKEADYSHIKVKEVIDGDTVRLSNGVLLRYIGIDTAEVRVKRNGTFYYEPKPFALTAKEFNRKLVENKFVRVEFDVETNDRYGRMLGYCFVGDTFVNQALVEEGLAVLYTYPPNVMHVDTLLAASARARKFKKGMWAAFMPRGHTQAKEVIGCIAPIRGRVQSVGSSEHAVFLNFGKDYKSDFSVVIFNDCLENFYKERINPEVYYTGEMVEVMGKVTEHNGPQIRVCFPDQIKVIDEE